MPLPLLSPATLADVAIHADWLANLDRVSRTAPPPPGRAACEASVRAAEHALFGPRRVPIW